MKKAKQFFREHDIWLRLLSLTLAFTLWAVVMAEENPDRTATFTDIPLTITGESQLLADYGLSVIETDRQTMMVTVRGPNDQVSDKDILRYRISAKLDVSGISEVGEYDLTPEITVSRTGVEVNNSSPQTVHVRIDELTSTSVPVHVEMTGTPANGYRAGKPEAVTTQKVTIEGPASSLQSVSYAYAVISADGATATRVAECGLTLYNDAGEQITDEHITCKTQKIEIRLPIYPIETLPLTVTVRAEDGRPVEDDSVVVNISPASVKVVGDPNIIAGMDEILLGEIDVGNARPGVPIEMRIPLPEGVRLDEGEPTTAQVSVIIEGVETRSIPVTRFAPNDTAQSGRYTATITTQQVELEVRGGTNELNQITEGNFTIGLTFDSDTLGVGVHAVKGLVVENDLPSGVTLLEDSVEVIIEIVETNPTEDAETPPSSDYENGSSANEEDVV